MYLNNEPLNCRLATVATASAGDNRRPTIHRMLISRNSIAEMHLEMLKSQLLLNTSDIIISSDNFNKLIAQENHSLPPKVLELFNTAIQKEEYYRLSEYQIKSLENVSAMDKLRSICLLRNFSTASKYNKIGSKCDELVFNYLSDIYSETDPE